MTKAAAKAVEGGREILSQNGHEPGEGIAFGPNGIIARWVFVTPEMAYDWLSNQAANRTLTERHAGKFIRDLLANRWLPTPQGMGKTTEGKIIDGQHRLYAIFESGVGAWMLVCENLPPETQKVIDDTRKRSFSDDRKIAKDSDYSTVAAIVTLIARAEAAWELSLKYNTMRFRQFSRAELDAKHQEVSSVIDLQRAARLGHRAYQNVDRLNATAVGALYYLVTRYGAGGGAPTAFIERIISNEGLFEGDPERAMRERIRIWNKNAMKRTGERQPMPDGAMQLAHLIIAYGKWAANKPSYRIDFNPGAGGKRGEGPFPRIYPKLEREL